MSVRNIIKLSCIKWSPQGLNICSKQILVSNQCKLKLVYVNKCIAYKNLTSTIKYHQPNTMQIKRRNTTKLNCTIIPDKQIICSHFYIAHVNAELLESFKLLFYFKAVNKSICTEDLVQKIRTSSFANL